MTKINLVTNADVIIDACASADVIIIDTETSSLHPWIDGKVLAGVGVKPLHGEMFYLPVRHRNSVNAPVKEVRRLFLKLRGKTLVFHNAKYDMAVLWQDGVDLTSERILDTIVMMRLVSEDETSYELKKLGDKYYPFAAREPRSSEVEKALKDYIRKNECYELLPNGDKKLRYDWVPAAFIADPYVRNDLRLTEFFYLGSLKRIAQYELEPLLELEIDLTQALFDMERYGFLLDMDYIAHERVQMDEMLQQVKQSCYDMAEQALVKRARRSEESAEALDLLRNHGRIYTPYKRKEGGKWSGTEDLFNVTNPHFVKKIFNGMGVESPTKTETGRDSWNKVALASFDHPLAEMIVRGRVGMSMKAYYDQFEALRDKDDIIHPSIMQAGARTGRLSCREPNLQNTPAGVAITSRVGALLSMEKAKKDEKERREKAARYEAIGKKQIGFDEEVSEEITAGFAMQLFKRVRGAFIPRPGNFLLSIDWQNIEMRIFADYANEKEIQETFRLGLDIHRLTARAAFGLLPDEEKEPDLFRWVRQMGKQIAFGLLYGMGIRLLAAEINRSEDEAKVFMKQFFARFRNAQEFIKRVHQRVKMVGYLRNRWGRRRNLSEEEAFKGVNYLIQGTAADLMKDAIVRVWKLLKPYKTQLILTVHDELIFDVSWDEAHEVIPLIVKEMEKCDKVSCDLKCDAEYGAVRWSELSKLSCKECEGKGVVVDMDKPTLINALYENDQQTLNKVRAERCDRCEGHGYDLDLLERAA